MTQIKHTGLFIDNAWSESANGTLAVLNPATGEQLTEVASASAEDVDRAVRSARAALDGAWGSTPASERVAVLNRIADLIERDGEILARLEALDIGRPIAEPTFIDVPNAVATFRHFAGWADKIMGSAIPTDGFAGRPTHSYTVREPVGVVGAILPWNGPLMIAGWKLAPALAAGNTIVVKPSEDAPLSLLHLASLMAEAGLPPGTVNMIPGSGDPAGKALVEHPDVNKISFTGSPEVGRAIQVAAAGSLKRLTLELGGKSPQIILADADVASAVIGCSFGLFANQGEVCMAGTRVLVHRSHYDEVVSGLVAAADAHVVGDPLDPSTTMGALINESQLERVVGYIEKGKAEGAELVAGGERPDGPGFFVQPTVFAGVDNQMVIAREEIFGPVGSVIPFDDADQAIGIANDSPYGLSATLWTRDVSQAHLLARRLRVGSVAINGWGASGPALPWGGVKGSGVGRELGWSGILSNTEEKTITVVL